MTQYANFRERSFVDKVRFKVKAGDGGAGCISFYRDRIVVSGSPDGGDGGKGGDMILKASDFFQDLRIFRRREILGNNGKAGRKGGSDGRNGNDLHISVPSGTLVYEILAEKKVSNLDPQKLEQKNKGKTKIEFYKKFLVDLEKADQEYVIATGGRGGKGNCKHRGMTEKESGFPG